MREFNRLDMLGEDGHHAEDDDPGDEVLKGLGVPMSGMGVKQQAMRMVDPASP